MNLHPRILLILSGLALLLAACALPIPTPDSPGPVTAPPDAVSLQGPVWLLQQLHGQPLLPDSRITLELAEGQLNGSAGCNSYFGGYEATGADFSLTIPLGATMMYCDGLMDQEQAFLEALPQATRFEGDESGLRFFAADGALLLRFVPQQDAVLEDTSWRLDTVIIGGDAATSLLSGAEITALFDPAAGQISGSAGCNTYFAGYALDGDSLTIGPAASTRMYCAEPQGLMEQEAHFLAQLVQTASYRIKGDSLQLLDTNGNMLFEFVLGG